MIYYPMLLKAVPKNIIWGGDRLKRLYNKVAPFSNIAESWELTVREDGMSVIVGGEYDGMSVSELIKAFPEALGTTVRNDFPLLIKFIDAARDLSVQVHPDDAYAAAHETDNGKTEMWYVLDANADAEIIYGCEDHVTEHELKKAVASCDLSDVLRRVKVSVGDVYFIPAGQVHALCSGVLIAEIQQNSNVTYRIYDYDRVDAMGKKRELHVSKALDTVMCYSSADIENMRFSGKYGRRAHHSDFKIIADCEYFRVSYIECKDGAQATFTVDEKSFAHLLFTDAENAELVVGGRSANVRVGESYFIAANSGQVTLRGRCRALLSEP